MMFQHTEVRRMLADSLRRFITERYGFDTRDQIAKSRTGYSAELWREFTELGILGALFEERHGGFGGAGFDIAVVFEELGRGLVLEPFLGSAVLAGGVIGVLGGELHQPLLSDLVAGKRIAALAHGEPLAHYNVAHVATRAERIGDAWVLQGQKAVVTHAEVSDVFVVSARTSGDVFDEEGISLFVVPANTGGLSLRGYPVIDGGRAAELTLDGVLLGPEALLGLPGCAYLAIEKAVDAGTLALCAEGLGAMEVVKEVTLDYLRTRKQFGAPIGSFQALQHRLADLLIEVEQARSAVIRAASDLASKDSDVRKRTVSAAKYTLGRVGALVAEEAIQMHGGIGMTWDLPLTHYTKRLIMLDHFLGDQDHHLDRYMALSER